MATGDFVLTNKYHYASGVDMGLKCTWEVQSRSEEAGETTIAWTLASDGASGHSLTTGNVSLVINEVEVFSHPGKFNMQGGGDWNRSGTLVIKHDEDGTKSFTISITAGVYLYTSSNCTGSDTFELDPFYRGVVYLDIGTGHEKYLVDVDNGTSWEQCIPETDDVTSWSICN